MRACECLNEALKRDEAGANVLLARALQKAAEAERVAARGRPLREAREAESAADTSAVHRLTQAVEALHGAAADDEDALVEEGNARSTKAVCLVSDALLNEKKNEADEELVLAEAAYRKALHRANEGEEDVDVLMNLGDVLRQRCELWQNPEHGEAADECYSKAVALLHSRQELDDGSNALHDWGSALYTFGTSLRENQRYKDAIRTLSRAEAKLKDVLSRDCGDLDACVAIGEVVIALAECLSEQGQRTEEVQRAKTEGFQRALAIDRSNVNAVVGMAEAELAKAREDSASAADEARQWYLEAMRAEPSQVGAWNDRGELAYNYACACSLAGTDFDGASVALQSAVQCGAATRSEVQADAELGALLHTHPIQI